MKKILEVNDLCKTYIINKRQNNVLRNVNFAVSEGEMVAVMGPSGSGKSTLLYTVSGMDKMTAGQSVFNGKDISKLNPNALAQLRLDEMGFIFQQMYMLKNLSVLDNILLPARQSKANTLSKIRTASRQSPVFLWWKQTENGRLAAAVIRRLSVLRATGFTI